MSSTANPRAGLLSSPAIIVVILLGFYFSIGGLLGSSGYLGSDSGGKVATLEANADRSGWSPDIGYWAEAEDPDGSLHPLFSTRRVAAGWVNVTTLPMVILAQPLYEVGGLRLALLLPMLGSAFAALGAGALARRMGDATGIGATWVVGLVSPFVVYAIDFWEHSWGVAAMTAGVVLTVDAADSESASPARAFVAGLAFALAAAMRQEALVYGAIAGLYLVSFARIRGGKALAPAGLMLGGFVAGFGLNSALEKQFFGGLERSGRASDVVTSGVIGRLSPIEKLTEAMLTFASPINLMAPLSILLALAVGACYFALTFGIAERRERIVRLSGGLLACIVLLSVLRVVRFGPVFVPSILVASPIAGIGFGIAARKANSIALVFGLLPLPLVWLFQYPGGAVAQWAGRYVLQSCLVLTVAGVVFLARHPVAMRWMLGAQVVMSLLGIQMLVSRTNAVTESSVAIESIDGVVVFGDPLVAREYGPLMINGQWLSAETDAKREEVEMVLVERGIERFTWVTYANDDREDLGFGDFGLSGDVRRVDNEWIPLRFVGFER